MFEDIIGSQNIHIDMDEYNKNPICISCGNVNISDIGGHLSSSTTFTVVMVCNYCGIQWHVIIDRNFTPLKIVRGIDK